jgi:hypothetical protein
MRHDVFIIQNGCCDKEEVQSKGSPSIGMNYAIKTPTGRHVQNSDRLLFQMAGTPPTIGHQCSILYAWDDRQIAHPDRALRDSQR